MNSKNEGSNENNGNSENFFCPTAEQLELEEQQRKLQESLRLQQQQQQQKREREQQHPKGPLQSKSIASMAKAAETTSSTASIGYASSSRRLWCWTMTTLQRGIVARFVCCLPIRRVVVSGLIYSATLERQPKRFGSIYHGAQRTTSKRMPGFTAKGKKCRLYYTT